jgi:predicted enzyme related to lactoylglutathione lyase
MKVVLASILVLCAAPCAAAQPAGGRILHVGAIAINPCKDAKTLAEWYSRFGIETKEIQGGYYGQIDTAAGPLVFGIHPKKSTQKQCSANVSVVYRVDNFQNTLLSLKSKGLEPQSTENDSQGRFAHFRDPDGNEVSIWGD